MPQDEEKRNSSRILLTKLRGGDYVHAGDEEAIEIILKKVLSLDPTLHSKAILDVGCGFGGTAQYLYQKGFKTIDGIDLDSAAIAYAKDKYPSFNFKIGDALDIDKLYPFDHFSLIYLLNVMYAVPDKATLLKKLAAVSKPEGILVVFDYTCGHSTNTFCLKDLADKPMYPLQMDNFQEMLKQAKWEILEITDMTAQYISWYRDLLKKLAVQIPFFQQEVEEQTITGVKDAFTFLLTQLEQDILGGVVIYARKETPPKS